jgi:hypothetical protein
MSIPERSTSRDRASGFVRGSSPKPLGPYDRIPALLYSNSQAAAALATSVLRPGSLRPMDPKIIRTLAAEIPSLLTIPMWYAICCCSLTQTHAIWNKVASTGRGGAGNIRSPSRDAIHAENGTPETSPIRSELRGRGYDRDLISVIDNSHDTGVVRQF